MATSTMLFLFTLTAYVLPTLPLVCAALFLRHDSYIALALCLLWLVDLLFIPDSNVWPAACAWLRRPFFQTWRAYHRYTIVCESPLDREGTYVFAAMPHGVFPQCQWLTNPSTLDPRDPDDKKVAEVFPMPLRGAVASILLRIPVLRHLLAWHGLVPASRETIAALLKASVSVVLIPGGIRELFESSPRHETYVLMHRKGFVRLAMDANVSLVPILCFGNTACFSVRTPQRLVSLSRALRAGLVLFWGRLGLPLPRPVQLTVVVGSPLAPQPGESVEELHGRFVQAVRALYDKHRAALGPAWAGRELRIV